MQSHVLQKIITLSLFQWRSTKSGMLSLPPARVVYEMFPVVWWSTKQYENFPRLIPGCPCGIPCCLTDSFSQGAADWGVTYVFLSPPGLMWRKPQLLKGWKALGAAVWADHDSVLGSSDFTSTWVHEQASVWVWERLYFLSTNHYTCFVKVAGSTSNSIQVRWTVCITGCPL